MNHMVHVRIYLLGIALILSGCGRFYHLPGHRAANLNHPPNITLYEGDRIRAISTGIVCFVMVFAVMESTDPEIVEVEIPLVRNLDTAYLIAKRPGKATVRYGYVPDGHGPNDGFVVTVLPKSRRGSTNDEAGVRVRSIRR